jgi:hypothetical protein
MEVTTFCVFSQFWRLFGAHTVTSKATDVFYIIFPLQARYSALTQSNKVSLYELLIRSILTYEYVAPVCSSTCSSNYLRLQVIQSKCLRVVGNHPRRTPHFPPAQLSKHPAHPRSHPPPYWLIFCSLLLTPPPVHQIANYTLADLTNFYKKCKHKRTQHVPL